jgi:hypothetical protein
LDSSTRAFYFVLLIGGLVTVQFMVRQLYATFKKGVIERLAPRQPFTRTDNPKAFWTFMVFCSLGTAGMIWGLAVVLFRLIGLPDWQ